MLRVSEPTIRHSVEANRQVRDPDLERFVDLLLPSVAEIHATVDRQRRGITVGVDRELDEQPLDTCPEVDGVEAG